MKKLGVTKSAALYLVALSIFWASGGSFILGAPVLDALKVLAFLLCAVALPGVAILKLSGARFTPLEAMLCSFALGLTGLTIVYFCFAPWGLMQYAKFAVYVYALAGSTGAVLLFKKKLSYFNDDGETRIALIFGTVALILTFLMLSANTINPELTGTRYFFHDTLNGVTLTTSAANGFPLKVLQMSGTENRYHLFYFIYTGLMHLATDIPSFEVVTKYSLIAISPMIICGLVALAKRILRNNVIVSVTAFILVFFSSGNFAHYLYKDTIGYPYGLALALVTVIVFLRAEENSQKTYSTYYYLSVIFLLMTLGAKGPVAVTLLFGMCLVLLFDLIRYKQWNVIPKGLIYTVTFLLLYYVVYWGDVNDSMSWSPIYTAIRTSFSGWLFKIGLPEWAVHILAPLQWSVFYDLTIFAAFVMMLILVKHFTENEKETFEIFTMGGCFIGLLLMNLFKQMGSSEIYFANIMVPFALIALFYFTGKYIGRPKKNAFAVIVLILVVSFSVGTYFSERWQIYFGGLKQSDIVTRTEDISDSFVHSRFFYDPSTEDATIDHLLLEDDIGIYITPDEYEAYIWIRENTPADSVLVDGHYLKFNKYFYGGTFTERAFYLEGYGFVTMEDTNDNTKEKIERDTVIRFFFTEEDEGYIASMSRRGCNYLIVSEFVSPGLKDKITDKWCNVVFQNDIVTVYKIHELSWD